MNKNKGIIGIGLIIAIVLGIVVIGGGVYYLGKSDIKKEVINPENKNVISNSVVVPNDWKTYIDKENGFEFKYPPEIVVDPDPSHGNSSIGFRGLDNPTAEYANEPPDTLDSVADFDVKGYSYNGNTAIISYTKVDGQDAKVICGSKDGNCTANITLPKPIKVGTYNNGSDKYFKFLVINEFFLKKKYVDQILSTFKFTNLSYQSL